MCLYPKLVLNPKYKANKKNGGKAPPLLDERVKYVAVGCGNCIECRRQKAHEWQTRLAEEIRTSKNGIFVTLTFSEESIEKLTNEIKESDESIENSVATLAVRRFLERFRKENKRSARHWLITELGHQNTERIHLHGLIFEDAEQIKKHWKYGWIYMGQYVNESTINYIVKYITKMDVEHKGFKGKILCSKGIGSNYLNRTESQFNKYKENDTREYYRLRTGQKTSLPIYYRNKIYSEEEREKLWIEKLEKQERYVLGQKIKINKGEDEYYRALKEAQKKNERLGYGTDEEEWTVKAYKRQRKYLKYKKMIEDKTLLRR